MKKIFFFAAALFLMGISASGQDSAPATLYHNGKAVCGQVTVDSIGTKFFVSVDKKISATLSAEQAENRLSHTLTIKLRGKKTVTHAVTRMERQCPTWDFRYAESSEGVTEAPFALVYAFVTCFGCDEGNPCGCAKK